MGRRRDQHAPARVGVSPSRTRPALISKAVAVLVGEDEMVEQSDAEQIGALLEPVGEHTILFAGCHITRGVIVGTCDVKSR